MYTLYYSPGAASMAVHLALLELELAHSLRRVDFDAREQKDPEYLRLNPNGLVPTLIVDGAAMSECAAMLLLLGERHGEPDWAPPAGDPRRPAYLQWMLYLANTVQPAFRQWFYPQDFGPPAEASTLREFARRRIETAWERVDTHLAAHGPHVLGAQPAIVDLYATMLMRWSRNMPKPADQWPALAALAATIKARPSWQRLYAIEGLTEWP